MRRFANKTVVVTGGASGMGASHVRGFVGEGANVVIADVLEEEGLRLAGELGDRVLSVRADVAVERDWSAVVKAAEDAFGPVSVLVNNAGVGTRQVTLDKMDLKEWQRVLDVNLTGQLLGIQAVVPSMRRAGGGSIVNISSALAFTGMAERGAYVISKWAIRGLTKVAALELGRYGIRVNSIHPGIVRTRMGTQPREGAAPVAAILPMDIFAIPRPAESEEITRLVLFVASDDASYSTGCEFIADGGGLLGPGRALPAASASA